MALRCLSGVTALVAILAALSGAATALRHEVGTQDQQARMFSFGMLQHLRGDAHSPTMDLEDCGRECQGLLDYGAAVRAYRSRWGTGAVGIALAAWCVVLIWLLNDTAQEYFVPPLVYWSRVLHLSPEMTGATLVALGNGAPDVFSIGVAAQRDAVPLALSELFGANIFVLCLTGCAVLMAWRRQHDGASGKSAFARAAKSREAAPVWNCAQVIVILMAATCLFHATVLQDRLGLLHAVFFPLLYVVYLGCLLLKGRGSQEPGPCGHSDAGTAELAGLEMPAPDASPLAILAWALAWPSYFLRWMLIPPADERWDRRRRLISACSPAGTCLFVVTCFVRGGVWALPSVVCHGLAVIVTACGLLILSCDDGPELPNIYPALALAAKLSSILLMSVIASEITALVMTLGIVLRLPAVFLGSTVIAWGNSLGDLCACVAMVNKGQARVAFTALFAGPLFNLLVGGGLALVMLARQAGGTVYLWRDRDETRASLLTTSSLHTAATMVVALALATRPSMARFWSLGLLVIYGIYAVVVLPMEYNAGGTPVSQP